MPPTQGEPAVDKDMSAHHCQFPVLAKPKEQRGPGVEIGGLTCHHPP